MIGYVVIPENPKVSGGSNLSTKTITSRSGEYRFKTSVSGWYPITLVGGGGGGRGNLPSGRGGKSNHNSAAGGSGAAFIGQVYLHKNREYRLVIGTGGAKNYTYTKVEDSNYNKSRDDLKKRKDVVMSKNGGATTLYENGTVLIRCGGGEGAGCASWYWNLRGLGGSYEYIANGTNTYTSDGKTIKHTIEKITGTRTIKKISNGKEVTDKNTDYTLGIKISGNKIKGKLVNGNDGMYGIRHGGGKGEPEWYHSYNFSAWYGLNEGNKHYGSNGYTITHKNEWGDKSTYSWLSSSEKSTYITNSAKSANKSFSGSTSYGAGGSAWGDNNDNSGVTSSTTCYDGKDGYASVEYKTGSANIVKYDLRVLYIENKGYFIGYPY